MDIFREICTQINALNEIKDSNIMASLLRQCKTLHKTDSSVKNYMQSPANINREKTLQTSVFCDLLMTRIVLDSTALSAGIECSHFNEIIPKYYFR